MINPKTKVKKINEFSNLSVLHQRNKFAVPTTEPIVNFKEPFSYGSHYENKFPETVSYGTYVSLPCNVEILRPDSYLQRKA